MQHAGFIVAAFAASGATILGLLAWVLLTHRRLATALREARR